METVLHIGKVILLIFAVLMIFNLMILVHEWGHFLAARWRGLKIEKFQIWFGKPIWKKTINGVQYGLGSIPAGGFVALPQMAPMEMLEGHTDEKGDKLPRITPMDKIIVAFAGPLFSFLLALFFAVIVYFVGKPVDSISETTKIGWVKPGSPAEEAGLLPGDEILSVDGYRVDAFFGPVDTVTERIVHSRGEKIKLVVMRDGREQEIESGYAVKDTSAFERAGFRQIGVAPSVPVRVGSVSKSSPAEAAGLKRGDLLVSINGNEIIHANGLVEVVQASEGKPVTLVVEREGVKRTFELTPVLPTGVKEAKYSLGIGLEEVREWTTAKPGPVDQVSDAAKVILRTLGSLFSSKSDVGPSHLSGPVGIGNIYYRLLDNPERGLQMALWFSVLLNVNLALLNMLPFPVLDGGHITMALMEGIRRKPINFRFLEYVQAACALLLLGFMAYVTIFDGRDTFSRNKAEENADGPPQFEVPAGAANREIPAN